LPRGRLRRSSGVGRAGLLLLVRLRAGEREGSSNEYGVDEHFMVVELSNGALDSVSGTVRYREEFREISA
jgi:hypothetical protein